MLRIRSYYASFCEALSEREREGGREGGRGRVV